MSNRNPWQMHFKNQEVRKNIRLDVERTFQKIEFFHRNLTKTVLEDVLFVWSMTHELGYRQGMNEIIAVIVFFAFNEEETIDGLASYEHIEPDAYQLFDKIMMLGLDNLYTNGAVPKLKNDAFLEIHNLDRSAEEEASQSIRRCHYIYHRILAKVDNELYKHILGNKFEPQLFFLRWIRCMLSREFLLNEIAAIWDVIFCLNQDEANSFDVLNYFCAAILVKNRELCMKYLVLEHSHSELLQILMKPLPIVDLKELIELSVFYYKEKVDKKLVGVHQREDSGILKKIMNLVAETIGPTPIGVMKQQGADFLHTALEHVNKAIEIAEKCKQQ